MSEVPHWFKTLDNPETYPHPVTKIEHLETHISWVVLTGEWAYKIKKPVDFGFVDFSNIELRLAACEEELRLNRRTAPTLYDSLAALRATPAGPRFGTQGSVLEYAVRMRQFDQSLLLDHLLENHRLSEEMVVVFAMEIARLHTQAARSANSDKYGSPELINKTVRECFDHLNGHVTPDHMAKLESLQKWMSEEGQRLTDFFNKRKQEGWVRECHGDLHLGNVVLYEGKPTLFDCLEFSPNLRWIDVINDVAFAVMDLRCHRAISLSWRLLNSWLSRTGDYSGLQVLDFYIAYRALVRAKVAALRLELPLLPAKERSLHQKHFDEYLDLGFSMTEPRRPFLVLMCGVSGSGKSHTAQRIACEFGAVQIRSDVERKRMFAGNELADSAIALPEHSYSRQTTERVYSRLLEIARDLIRSRHSVVVDASFLLQGHRNAFIELAKEFDLPHRIVKCLAPEAVLQQRIQKRRKEGHDASDADLNVLAMQLVTLEPLDNQEMERTIVFDTAREGLGETTSLSSSNCHGAGAPGEPPAAALDDWTAIAATLKQSLE